MRQNAVLCGNGLKSSRKLIMKFFIMHGPNLTKLDLATQRVNHNTPANTFTDTVN